mgnify:CR=1 FL=1
MQRSILIGIIVIVIIAAGLYYFLVMQKPVVEPIERGNGGLGSELLENPGTAVPQTNPFEDVDTNPLQGTNPFEGGYKNPFGE